MRGHTNALTSPAQLLDMNNGDLNREDILSLPVRTEVLVYHDPVTEFAGYLAVDGQENPLAAGGFRIQLGLTPDMTASLARAMTLKQRLLGLGVDGAKCGIDFDPKDPGVRKAMRRFLGFLRPHLLDRFSMGPDMGTTWSDIESAARAEGIPSAKIAIARAQGLSEADVLHRLALLDTDAAGRTLAQRRAGHGLAHAALAAIEATARVNVGVQGFGTLGRAATLSLAEAGARIVAVADEFGSVIDTAGLDVPRLLATAHRAPVTNALPHSSTHRAALWKAPVDLLVLAAHEDAMSAQQALALPESVRAIVVGANLGLAPAVEDLLGARGVEVVPDFVGGCGGSASMDALFGSPTCPTPAEFLDRLGATMRATTRRVLEHAASSRITPRAAALTLCAEAAPRRPRPYGPSGGEGDHG